MARARNIKPGFFSHDELAEVSPLGRLLFIALWTMADRAGRLEDRPKRIKVEALPYDNCDAESLLSELADRGFILRYARGGRRFIQVVNFAKHQNPHVREPESDIPGPDEPGSPPGGRPSGCSDEPDTSTVLAPDENRTGTNPAVRIPDSGFLIPDSPSRIPDSGVEEARASPSKRSPRGSRIPPGFPAEAEIAWCRAERPSLDPGDLAAKFRDYWLGVPGQRGCKADWPATWRNFVRSEWSRSPPARASPSRQDRISATVAELTGRNREPEVIDVVATERPSVR